MMITTKGRNALKVMIDLAQHNDGSNISLTDIAERQHESVKYLEAVMGPLSQAGLVLSARGKSAGYRLAKPAEECSIGEIIVGGGGTACARFLSVFRCPLRKRVNCLSLPLWKELDEVIMNFLNSKKLSDLIK